jgi:hypothetical protein
VSDLDTLITRVKTVGGMTRAYKLGAVPGAPATPYAVLSLDTGAPMGARVGGQEGKLYRLAVQCFGTTDDAVRDMADRADTAFRSKTLTELPGTPFSRREIAATMVRDPDAGGLLGLIHTYKF